ncbi:MAG: NAD+ synthase, partial [Thiohalophilus sp.]|uniref:NAD+ synthase n=1 Tax=Thiohalophilus sp. TaxID=3028392 RepID=UPI0028701A70
MPEQELRIAIAQINLLVGEMEGNARRIIEAMQDARDNLQADILITPELALTGYPPEDLLLRPGMYERIDRALLQIQQQVTGIDLLLGYPEQTPEGVYNSAAVIREGKIIAHARKENLPNYSVFDEKRYFTPEHDSCVVRIKGANVGITICEDIWFPEPPQRLKQAGADLILNINASPYHINKGYEREQAVADRCRETGLPVVYANLVGGQDELVFDGDSFVMNGQSTVTQRVPAFTEKLERVRFKQTESGWQPVQTDVLPAPLSTTASVYQALVLGVRDFVHKNGFNGGVIGLSGGIDSALTLAIAVDALGGDEIEAVMMPSRYTADMSVEDAAEQARTQSVNYRVIAIEQPFNAFLEILADEFAGLPVDTTEENIQARCRGVLLMAISNKKRKMVLTTGNKSEMAVGYATLYGDMAGGFDVLKDVPKTLVYELANYRNTLSPVIPQRVIDRPPSAELAPDQQDTDSLPPYDVLDAILEMYVEKDMGLEDIVSRGYDREIVQKVMQMVTRNEYKRRQAP